MTVLDVDGIQLTGRVAGAISAAEAACHRVDLALASRDPADAAFLDNVEAAAGVAPARARVRPMDPAAWLAAVDACAAGEAGAADLRALVETVAPRPRARAPRGSQEQLDTLAHLVRDTVLPPVLLASLVHEHVRAAHPFGEDERVAVALAHVVLRRRGLTMRALLPLTPLLRSPWVDTAGPDGTAGPVDTAGPDGRVGPDGVVGPDGGVGPEAAVGFAGVVLTAAESAERKLAELSLLQQRWRDALRSWVAPRQDAAAWRIIEVLPALATVSLPGAIRATGRSKAQVNQALGQLEAVGVLQRVTTGRRNRGWTAGGLGELLAPPDPTGR